MDVSVQTSSPPVTRSSLPLPDDLVLEIFVRLPTKAIARCRCLSKLWASIFRSQYFTELFFTKSCARPQLLFAFRDDSDVLFFSSPQPENPKENSYVVAANQLARFPRSYGFSALTSGFFCYAAERIFEEGMEESEFVPVICNPSTGQSLILPTLKSRSMFRVESYLGYEPIGKQFKILSVCYGKKFHVLTLGTKKLSWRVVECCVPHRPSTKCICISGVIYYAAEGGDWFIRTLVVCFDLRSEKLSFVEFMETISRAMHQSITMVNYNGKLGFFMSRDYGFVTSVSTSLGLWVLRDAGKNEWSKLLYVLPPSWKDVVTETMRIIGMVGTNEIVFAPTYQQVTSYVIYFNVERKTIIEVGIRGMEAFQGKRFYTYLNYSENVKLL